MNWIPFDKERPKKEPRRQIWVSWISEAGKRYYDAADSDSDLEWAHMLTSDMRWAEIEPPGRTPSKSLGACAKGPEEPEPDPFEEWFRSTGVFIFDNPNGKYDLAKAAYDKGWDAAMKHKEPDPFEQAWGPLSGRACCSGKEFARLFWDAAMKHKEAK